LVLNHPAVLKVCRYVGHHAHPLLSSNPSLIASNRNSLAVVAYQILTHAHDYSLLMALKRITKVLTTSSTTTLEILCELPHHRLTPLAALATDPR
jgi:hypothetical protein